MKVKNNYLKKINRNNIDKFIYLLDRYIESHEEEKIKSIAIVVSCLSGSLATTVLEHYPPQVQAEVVAQINDYKQFDYREVNDLINNIEGKVDYVFGGKSYARELIEQLDKDEKKAITRAISKHYPDYEKKISDIVVFFEDLFALPAEEFEKVFTEIPTSVLAIAMAGSDKDKKEKLYKYISTGMKNMIEQMISFRKNNMSDKEIEDAQKYIIDRAVDLEKKRLINIKHQEE